MTCIEPALTGIKIVECPSIYPNELISPFSMFWIFMIVVAVLIFCYLSFVRK